ncbi:tetratricopeptide repeat protein [Pseudomonas sp. TE3610]
MKPALLPLLLSLACIPAWALEGQDQQRLTQIQNEWASIQYQMPADKRGGQFEQLHIQATQFTQDRQQMAEAWIWAGIVDSSWAGATGGLGALGKVKDARTDFETALRLDPKALQGSAYTSLAALYDRVPGWPVGFGDADKAESLLKQALALNPEGIDTLYFWGDHLYRRKRYAEAKQALLKALQAPPRPGRETADAGRRQDIDALLKDVEGKLN